MAILFIFTLTFSADNTIDSNIFNFSLFLMPITIGTTYVSIYKLIPNYLITKRYILFGLYSLYTIIISIFSIMFSVFFAIAFLTNFMFTRVESLSRNTLFIITCVYLVVIIVSAFKLLKLNLKQSKYSAELEAKILETQLKLKEQELNYLKMQIHPHFLFNTLNTLYGFALKKAEETPEMILKLSNLLDYLLYQVDKPFVGLNDEMNHIEDYISLEKMRFNETLNVTFNKEIASETIEIAPMLFIPFIENSFKHGAIRDGVLDIAISIKADSEEILFNIKNTCSKDLNYNDGLGLENIKKRLELLYPNRYNLEINKSKSEFMVSLKLSTKSKL
ncbi:histidine kinase [Winogradskyella echinorum]|uniref:Histidine kinase n=1 Tax=Winogradskyella echinorum TaxID=538189 RepID=A0ABR6Y5I2_9FLAO|nr:histidine kinase [Winogradskyella echinorum]MBC3847965.1 histidine kinase [Winogradskyella echinorum]MBC5752313.1 histidine kinase [Winogradskyella echinorum]